MRTGHLRTVDFLAGLDPKQIEVVAQGARIEQCLSGERVVHQNESGDELYIILSGSADVQIEQNDLHSVVNHLFPGQFFGEMSLLTGEPRSATVVATSCLRVIVVGQRVVDSGRKRRSSSDRANRGDGDESSRIHGGGQAAA